MQPLNATDFTFNTNKINSSHVNLIYTLTKPHNDLMTFAIYTRNFTADGQPVTPSSASTHLASFPIIIVVLLALGLCISSAFGTSSRQNTYVSI